MSQKSKFENSVISMQGNLLSFALKLTTNREEAMDLVQDTTLKALNNEEKFVDNTNIKVWMLTMMRNILINNYRKSVGGKSVIGTADNL